MWHCMKCRESTHDDFQICWNCGTARDGTENSDFRHADHISVAALTGTVAETESSNHFVRHANADLEPERILRRPNRLLFWIGLAWPFTSLGILNFTTGITGIPHEEHLYLLAFILPAVAIISVVVAKLQGTRFDWKAIGLFSVWMTAMGWLNFSCIAAIWNSI